MSIPQIESFLASKLAFLHVKQWIILEMAAGIVDLHPGTSTTSRYTSKTRHHSSAICAQVVGLAACGGEKIER